MVDPGSYPVNLTVDYPDRDLNRLTTFFRLFTVIPIVIVLGLLSSGGSWSWGDWTDTDGFQFGAAGVLFLPTLLMIVFRQKYPRWWYDWNLALIGFSVRVSSYLALLRDEYPSTDEDQAVHITMSYPNVQQDLNRWLPLIKWFLAIPHYILLFILGIAAFVCVIVAWFAILVTGRYPRSLFTFVVDVERWALRVAAYTAVLVTDQYPPFRLGE
jgi:hypothetical protein